MNSRYPSRESVKTLGNTLLNRENEIISELRSFKTDTRNNFKVVNAKLDGMDDKLNSLDDANKGLNSRIDKLDDANKGLNSRIDKLDGRMDKLENRIDGLDTKLDKSVSELKSMIQIILDRKQS
ncbi:MAG: coiled-coil domain-containing protein, partial [Campylobacterales bacterium]